MKRGRQDSDDESRQPAKRPRYARPSLRTTPARARLSTVFVTPATRPRNSSVYYTPPEHPRQQPRHGVPAPVFVDLVTDSEEDEVVVEQEEEEEPEWEVVEEEVPPIPAGWRKMTSDRQVACQRNKIIPTFAQRSVPGKREGDPERVIRRSLRRTTRPEKYSKCAVVNAVDMRTIVPKASVSYSSKKSISGSGCVCHWMLHWELVPCRDMNSRADSILLHYRRMRPLLTTAACLVMALFLQTDAQSRRNIAPQCRIVPSAGRCMQTEKRRRWSYSAKIGACAELYGCYGIRDRNVFMTRAGCERNCFVTGSNDPSINSYLDCEVNPSPGLCQESEKRTYYSYSSKTSSCMQINGCYSLSDRNIFLTRQGCRRNCILNRPTGTALPPIIPGVVVTLPTIVDNATTLPAEAGYRVAPECTVNPSAGVCLPSQKRNYFTFSSKSGSCVQIYGCYSVRDRNVFLARDSCRSNCIIRDTTGSTPQWKRDSECYINPSPGRCSANERQTLWTFSSKTNDCQQMFGCYSVRDRNIFRTLSNCRQKCVGSGGAVTLPSVDLNFKIALECRINPSPGVCTDREKQRFFSYSSKTGDCDEIYGCYSVRDRNVYMTRSGCRRSCFLSEGSTQSGIMESQCYIVPSQGVCLQEERKTYFTYSTKTNTCVRILGCYGIRDRNVFLTRAGCVQACSGDVPVQPATPSVDFGAVEIVPLPDSPDYTIAPECRISPSSGVCRESQKRQYYTFSSKTSSCVRIYGCYDIRDRNVFLRRDGCRRTCYISGPATPSGVMDTQCYLNPAPGRCQDSQKRSFWSYSSKTMSCIRLYGCYSIRDRNVFLRKANCESSCTPGVSPQTSTMPPIPIKDVNVECRINPSPGRCQEQDRRTYFSYSAKTHRCTEIFGCYSIRDRNVFLTRDQCRKGCFNSEHPPGRDAQCSVNPSPGNCAENQRRTYYSFSSKTSTCVQIYGCYSVRDRNVFFTRAGCRRHCVNLGDMPVVDPPVIDSNAQAKTENNFVDLTNMLDIRSDGRSKMVDVRNGGRTNMVDVRNRGTTNRIDIRNDGRTNMVDVRNGGRSNMVDVRNSGTTNMVDVRNGGRTNMVDVRNGGRTNMVDVRNGGRTNMVDVRNGGTANMLDIRNSGRTSMADVRANGRPTMVDVRNSGRTNTVDVRKGGSTNMVDVRTDRMTNMVDVRNTGGQRSNVVDVRNGGGTNMVDVRNGGSTNMVDVRNDVRTNMVDVRNTAGQRSNMVDVRNGGRTNMVDVRTDRMTNMVDVRNTGGQRSNMVDVRNGGGTNMVDVRNGGNTNMVDVRNTGSGSNRIDIRKGGGLSMADIRNGNTPGMIDIRNNRRNNMVDVRTSSSPNNGNIRNRGVNMVDIRNGGGNLIGVGQGSTGSGMTDIRRNVGSSNKVDIRGSGASITNMVDVRNSGTRMVDVRNSAPNLVDVRNAGTTMVDVRNPGTATSNMVDVRTATKGTKTVDIRSGQAGNRQKNMVDIRGGQTGNGMLDIRGGQTGTGMIDVRRDQTSTNMVDVRGGQTGRSMVDIRGRQTSKGMVDIRGGETGTGMVDIRGAKTGTGMVDINGSGMVDIRGGHTGVGMVDIRSGQTGSGMVDIRGGQTGTGMVDIRSGQSGSGMVDIRGGQTGTGMVDIRSGQTGSGMVDIRGGQTGSGLVDIRSGQTGAGMVDIRGGQTGSGLVDIRSGQTGQTGSGMVDIRGGQTGTGMVDIRSGQTGSGMVDIRGGQTGTGMVDIRSGQTGAGMVDIRGGQTVSNMVDIRGGQTDANMIDIRGVAADTNMVDIRGGRTGSSMVDIRNKQDMVDIRTDSISAMTDTRPQVNPTDPQSLTDLPIINVEPGIRIARECLINPTPGFCLENQRKTFWTFSTKTNSCTRIMGCFDIHDRNTWLSLEGCRRNCFKNESAVEVNDGVLPLECQLNPTPGRCLPSDEHTVWVYNTKLGACTQITGCYDFHDRNVWSSRTRCRTKCRVSASIVAPEIPYDIEGLRIHPECHINPSPGRCLESQMRTFWTFSSKTSACTRITGCYNIRDRNTWRSRDECRDSCYVNASDVSFAKPLECKLVPSPGRCLDSQKKSVYTYSDKLGLCVEITGCYDFHDRNVWRTVQACNERCHVNVSVIPDLSMYDIAQECQLNPTAGRCLESQKRSFYTFSSKAGGCVEIYGCYTINDRNVWYTRSGCRSRCLLPKPACLRPPMVRPCLPNQKQEWFSYDTNTGACEKIQGCYRVGDQNVFINRRRCEMGCFNKQPEYTIGGIARECRLNPTPGVCHENDRRTYWSYSQKTGTCVELTGCYTIRDRNVWLTREMCRNNCFKREVEPRNNVLPNFLAGSTNGGNGIQINGIRRGRRGRIITRNMNRNAPRLNEPREVAISADSQLRDTTVAVSGNSVNALPDKAFDVTASGSGSIQTAEATGNGNTFASNQGRDVTVTRDSQGREVVVSDVIVTKVDTFDVSIQNPGAMLTTQNVQPDPLVDNSGSLAGRMPSSKVVANLFMLNAVE